MVLLHAGASVVGLLRSFFVAERIAARDGFLQGLRPRATLLGTGCLLVAVVVSRHPLAVAALSAVPVALAVVSSVPLSRLLARSAVVPLASALVVAPQAVLLPGPTLLDVGGLTVSTDGLAYVATFTVRVWTGVALLALVVLTTPFSAVVAALRRFGIPDTVVWLLVITYRYLFLFLSELRRLLLARESRTVGRRRRRDAWTDAGRLAGTFLLRAVARGERVHRGMRARGGARPPSPYRQSGTADPADYAFVASGAVVTLAAVVVRWFH